MSIQYLIYAIIASAVTVTLHEFTKAMLSSKLGDPLPEKHGRKTLNPLKHIEPIGFIMMVFFRFGWGKPVDTAAVYYKNRKRDTVIVYTMPSIISLIFGIIFGFISRIAYYYLGYLSLGAAQNHILLTVLNHGSQLFYFIALFNLRHAFFNIIPVYPLDGSKVLSCFLSPNNVIKMTTYQNIFQIILIILILTGTIGQIINPICSILL